MRQLRRLVCAAEQARYPYQPQRHTLDAAAAYGEAVTSLHASRC